MRSYVQYLAQSAPPDRVGPNGPIYERCRAVPPPCLLIYTPSRREAQFADQKAPDQSKSRCKVDLAVVALKVDPWSQFSEIYKTYDKPEGFWGLGVALSTLAMPHHEGGLDTLGMRCRAVFSRGLGGPRPTPCAAGPLVQLSREGVLEVVFFG